MSIFSSVSLTPTDLLIVPLGNNEFNFSTPYFSSNSIYTPKWLFGDGTSSFGTTTVNHQYTPPPFTFDVTLQAIRVDGTVACSFTKTINLSVTDCGQTKEKSDSKTFNNVDGSGEKWRIDAKVWVLNGAVGSSTKTLKKGFLSWKAKKVQKICTGFGGYYWREITMNGVKTYEKVEIDAMQCLLITPSGVIASFVQFEESDNQHPRREANKFFSKHSFKRTSTSTELFFNPVFLD